MKDYPYYSYKYTQASRYTFTSVGKKSIEKKVVFTYTGIRNIVNMGFGDILPDGTIDDKANSNNGDIAKVLSTIIQILMDFTAKFPETVIFLSGSTQERTRLYTRILRMYYSSFSKEFNILGLIIEDNDFKEHPFEPNLDLKYVGFIIKRFN